MIHIHVEALKVSRNPDNTRMNGEFRISSVDPQLSKVFSFAMVADNLTQPNKIEVVVKKDGKEFCKAVDDEAFFPEKSDRFNQSQLIVVRAMDELFKYFFGVHESIQGAPIGSISQYMTHIPDESAMDLLNACL